MLARRAGWSSRFSPSPMRARRTICRLTGSLSAAVAFPAKTRARSRTSWERTRRTLVLFANITPPGSGRPSRSPSPWPELEPSPDPFLYLKYNLLYDIYFVKRDLAGAAERGSPRTGGPAGEDR